MKRKVSLVIALAVGILALSLPACMRMQAGEEQTHDEQNTIVVTTPEARDVIITQRYVCQIRSRNHTEVKALEEGYLEKITVKEGQRVKAGDVLFRVRPILYEAKLEAEKAKAKVAEIKLKNTQKLFAKGYVSDQEVLLNKAELAEAEAKVQLAEAELKFTEVKAPFDGIIDRQRMQQGSLVKKDEILTTISDNDVMWVRFNVPEARYFEYMAGQDRGTESQQIELQLANGNKFQYTGTIGAIEADFNNETGNIQFRADFPNPHGLLRDGQTGTVLIHRTLHNAIVIPQRGTFETLDKQYVWVVGEDHMVHRRPITIQHELEDIFVIENGLGLNDKIILEGVRQVTDGQKLEEFEFQKPGEALTHQKFHAE